MTDALILRRILSKHWTCQCGYNPCPEIEKYVESLGKHTMTCLDISKSRLGKVNHAASTTGYNRVLFSRWSPRTDSERSPSFDRYSNRQACYGSNIGHGASNREAFPHFRTTAHWHTCGKVRSIQVPENPEVLRDGTETRHTLTLTPRSTRLSSLECRHNSIIRLVREAEASVESSAGKSSLTPNLNTPAQSSDLCPSLSSWWDSREYHSELQKKIRKVKWPLNVWTLLTMS